MSKKSQSKNLVSDPLEGVALFDPKDQPEDDSLADPGIPDEPISPLDSTEVFSRTSLSQIEIWFQEANRRIEQLQRELASEREQRKQMEQQFYELKAIAAGAAAASEELAQEREIKLSLEREMARIETEIKHAEAIVSSLETEREARLELERQVSSLQSRVELLSSASEDLEEERQARLELERETATLEMEVKQARKLEQLLTEERQARANAQMRASTADAKVAQLEGELSGRDSKRKSSFWRR